ncbi:MULTISPECIES: hypothetical protein [unclassified Leptolyngbya]|nr:MULTISPECIES: hypothetical protein [unclassified Leptolyngbya]
MPAGVEAIALRWVYHKAHQVIASFTNPDRLARKRAAHYLRIYV